MFMGSPWKSPCQIAGVKPALTSADPKNKSNLSHSASPDRENKRREHSLRVRKECSQGLGEMSKDQEPRKR